MARTSAAWQAAYDELLDEMGRWIKAASRRNEPIPFAGGHDECNYTASWPTFARLTDDKKPMRICRALCDQLLAWPKRYHGFYPDAVWDIEHSVENWTVFMRAMAEADPGDEVTLAGIEDLVHHLGNWADGCPDWFDWKRRRFVSEWIGTRAVKDFPPHDYSAYWDARAAELGLAYHDLRGDDRYLEFASAFARGWADYLLAQEGLGYWLMLDADPGDREGFRSAYGEYPEDFNPRYMGWAPEMMEHLLHVHSRTGEGALLEAARKIAELARAVRALIDPLDSEVARGVNPVDHRPGGQRAEDAPVAGGHDGDAIPPDRDRATAIHGGAVTAGLHGLGTRGRVRREHRGCGNSRHDRKRTPRLHREVPAP